MIASICLLASASRSILAADAGLSWATPQAETRRPDNESSQHNVGRAVLNLSGVCTIILLCLRPSANTSCDFDTGPLGAATGVLPAGLAHPGWRQAEKEQRRGRAAAPPQG